MDSQRPYVPAPPLTSMSQPPPQTHSYPFPPPPPRPPPQSAHNIVPPPPPGPPPGCIYGVSSGWQRGPRTPGFPPPPPTTLLSNQTHNQHLAFPPPSDPPLVSATYIPGGKSFGPGVGIPPFSQDPSQPELYPYQAEPEDVGRSGLHHSYRDNPADSFYARNDRNSSSTQVNRMPQHAHPPRDPLPAPAAPQSTTLLGPQAHHQPDLSKAPSIIRRKHSSNTSLGGTSPNDASTQWPLDRVLLWLANNNFSSDWQETFKVLGLEGADFIELGRGANRVNLSKMHQVVYPQLTEECSKSGTGWDWSREREEGARMRKLIRKIAENGNIDNASLGHRRHDSSQLLHSASTDEGQESYHNGQRPLSATSNTGDNNQGQQFSFRNFKTGSARQNTSPQYRTKTSHLNPLCKLNLVTHI
jgi:mitogen-activated protein kinase kinase kinase